MLARIHNPRPQRAMFRCFGLLGLGVYCGERFPGLRAWRFTPGCHILGFQPGRIGERRRTEDGWRKQKVESRNPEGGASVLRCFGLRGRESITRTTTTTRTIGGERFPGA